MGGLDCHGEGFALFAAPFAEIPVRSGRYAPGRLTSPRAEPVRWSIEHQDRAGNVTGALVCPDAVELRFARPGGGSSFQITIHGRAEGGEGTELTVVVPADRLGILRLPAGFAVEQSLMGAVYRLPQPHHIRLLVEQKLDLPALTFTVELS